MTEMVKKIHKMVLDDSRIEVHKLVDMVGIQKSDVHHILTENLGMKMNNDKKMTIKQKQRRKDFSIESLAMFHSNKADFSRRFITMDETWVHHFTPETKEQLKQ